MVTNKVQPRPRTRRASPGVSAVGRRRPRAPALVPEHVGELGSVALLAMAVLGLAIVIAGLAMLVFGLTMGARYPVDPPPNLAQLGVGQVVGGVGLVVLGATHIALAAAIVAQVRLGRPAAVIVNALTAALAVVGVGLVVGQSAAPDRVLAATLAVVALIYGAAALVLFRRR